MPVVNVDGERALAVVRASGAKSDISLGSQHFGVAVAIGAETGLAQLQTIKHIQANAQHGLTLEHKILQAPLRSRICWLAQSAGSIATWRAHMSL